MDKLSYALGIGIGTQLSGMGAGNLNIDDFAQAIKDVIAGNDTLKYFNLLNMIIPYYPLSKSSFSNLQKYPPAKIHETYLHENV